MKIQREISRGDCIFELVILILSLIGLTYFVVKDNINFAIMSGVIYGVIYGLSFGSLWDIFWSYHEHRHN